MIILGGACHRSGQRQPGDSRWGAVNMMLYSKRLKIHLSKDRDWPGILR